MVFTYFLHLVPISSHRIKSKGVVSAGKIYLHCLKKADKKKWRGWGGRWRRGGLLPVLCARSTALSFTMALPKWVTSMFYTVYGDIFICLYINNDSSLVHGTSHVVPLWGQNLNLSNTFGLHLLRPMPTRLIVRLCFGYAF